MRPPRLSSLTYNVTEPRRPPYQCTWWHRSIWMSGMEISCNVISKSCLFPTDPTEKLKWDQTEVCKFSICTKRYRSGYNNNSHVNFISAENNNINYVSIPKQKYRTKNKRDSHKSKTSLMTTTIWKTLCVMCWNKGCFTSHLLSFDNNKVLKIINWIC